MYLKTVAGARALQRATPSHLTISISGIAGDKLFLLRASERLRAREIDCPWTVNDTLFSVPDSKNFYNSSMHKNSLKLPFRASVLTGSRLTHVGVAEILVTIGEFLCFSPAAQRDSSL